LKNIPPIPIIGDIVSSHISDIRFSPYYYVIQKIERTTSNATFRANLLTCYFRHLKLVFEQIGIEITSENRLEIDKKIHALVNVPYKNCSAAWKVIKNKMVEDEEKFLADLEGALA